MKITGIIGLIFENFASEAKRIAETRFIWMPGARPVKVPARMPAINAKEISMSIY